MRDRDTVLLAIAAWLGAIASWPAPRWIGVVIALAGLASRRPYMMMVGVALLACGLGAAARSGLDPMPRRDFVGEVELVSDPVPVRGGVRADVRAEGHRFEATASGSTARLLQRRVAGDHVLVEGRIKPRRADAPWLDARHVVAKLEVEHVETWRPGSLAARGANAVRQAIANGASSLPASNRALYTGMVFGDDRGQPPLIVDDLRAAGLGHLLAVSGQNVAVVLGAAQPLLERCRYRIRFPLTLTLLGSLLLVTRAEPSVLRAATMSGVVALAAAMGRSTSSLRVLALSVTALLLIDPLLVEAIGFRLSVAASAGIVLLATPISARIPAPRPIADTAGVTLAAQVAVAPIVLSTFGGLPVASLPANVLVAPVPGPLMVWGATGGVVAGAVGGPVATVLHLPTRLMLGWVQLVGRVAGRAPLGELHARHLLVAVPAAAVLLFHRSMPHPWLRIAAAAALVGALLAPAVALHGHRSVEHTIAPGVQLWRDGAHAVVVLDGRADAVRALEGLRRAGVRRIDVAIARTGGLGVGDVIRALDGRYPITATWAPQDHSIRGAAVPADGTVVRAGPFELHVESTQPRLDVRVDVVG